MVILGNAPILLLILLSEVCNANTKFICSLSRHRHQTPKDGKLPKPQCLARPEPVNPLHHCGDHLTILLRSLHRCGEYYTYAAATTPLWRPLHRQLLFVHR